MIKTYCFELYNSKRNKHLHGLINLSAQIYNHCIALHKRYEIVKKSSSEN